VKINVGCGIPDRLPGIKSNSKTFDAVEVIPVAFSYILKFINWLPAVFTKDIAPIELTG
jgi:hypothetical protein